MVHNGIEYADMQLIGEAHELLKAAGLDNDEMADVFATWNSGDPDSYFIVITRRSCAELNQGVQESDLRGDERNSSGSGPRPARTISLILSEDCRN